MAFSGIGKLISALTAQTSIADTDCFMVGTNDVKKITWANVITAIKEKLGGAATKSVANNLTTATAGTSVLDAYQGKLLKEQLDELNTNIIKLQKRKHIVQYVGGSGGNAYVDIAIPDGQKLISYPYIHATINSETTDTSLYILYAKRNGDNAIRVGFSKSFTSAVIVGLSYSVE